MFVLKKKFTKLQEKLKSYESDMRKQIEDNVRLRKKICDL